eukprot:1047176-Pyramimonas_sp.AAC.1
MDTLDRLRTELRSTATSVNRRKLRRGERLDPDHAERVVSNRGRGLQQRPSAWTLHGTIVHAFGRIGGLSPDAWALRESRSSLSAIGRRKTVHIQFSWLSSTPPRPRASSRKEGEG